jgi:hypothetical protein
MAVDWSGSEGIESAFLEMMPDTITFNGSTAMDKYGKKTFGGSTVTARGRIMNDTVLIKDQNGQDIVTEGHVILYGNYSSLTIGHKMTLPNSLSPVIIKIDNKSDTAGTHHTVVYFGR